MSVDVSRFNGNTWKEFRLGDLFELKRGKTLTSEQKENFCGNIPCVNGTAENNGVFCKLSREIENEGFKIIKAPAITIIRVGCGGKTFVQVEDFYIADNAFALIPTIKIPISSMIFISTLLDAEQIKYSYGRTITSEYKNTIIRLPATPSGEPDWEWMESYIRSLHHKPLTTSNKVGQAPELDVEGFRLFRLGDLFKIRRGDRIVHNEDYFDVQDNEYKHPVITTTAANNGVDGFYNQTNCNGNCIVSGGEANGMFTTYQEHPFWGLDTVRIYEPIGFKMNKYIGLFLATELSFNMYRFSYGRKAKPDNMYTLDIRLPATPSGEPDWEWMESYIRSLPYGDRLNE